VLWTGWPLWCRVGGDDGQESQGKHGERDVPVPGGPVPAPEPKSSPIPPRGSDSDVTAEPRFSAETAIAKGAVVPLAQSGYRTGRTLLVVAVTGAAPACR
jgi:hypothetical protein